MQHGALWACGYRAWIKKHSRIITDATESFTRIRFLIFSFWFIFWFSFWLYLAGQEGFQTDFASACALALQRNIYVCKIKYTNMTISISAAASGNACKSVYNPFESKKQKNKKNPWSTTPCASVIIRERFFDLRSVAAGSQNELLQVLSIFL